MKRFTSSFFFYVASSIWGFVCRSTWSTLAWTVVAGIQFRETFVRWHFVTITQPWKFRLDRDAFFGSPFWYCGIPHFYNKVRYMRRRRRIATQHVEYIGGWLYRFRCKWGGTLKKIILEDNRWMWGYIWGKKGRWIWMVTDVQPNRNWQTSHEESSRIICGVFIWFCCDLRLNLRRLLELILTSV